MRVNAASACVWGVLTTLTSQSGCGVRTPGFSGESCGFGRTNTKQPKLDLGCYSRALVWDVRYCFTSPGSYPGSPALIIWAWTQIPVGSSSSCGIPVFHGHQSQTLVHRCDCSSRSFSCCTHTCTVSKLILLLLPMISCFTERYISGQKHLRIQHWVTLNRYKVHQ